MERKKVERRKDRRKVSPAVAVAVIAVVAVLAVALIVWGSRTPVVNGPSGIPVAFDRLGIKVEAPPGGFNAAGVRMGSLVGAPTETKVATVDAGGPADKAGVKPGDMITEVNGAALARPEILVQALVTSGGMPLTLTLKRAGNSLQVSLQPKPSPYPTSPPGFKGSAPY